MTETPTKHPQSVRRLWIRPLLFGIALVTLPFPWIEVQGSCGAPMYSREIKTGLQLLGKDVAPPIILCVLVLLSLALLFLAPRLTRGTRVVAQLVATIVNGVVLLFTWFLVTFQPLSHIKLKPAVLVAVTAMATTLVESVWRMTLDLREMVARRDRRR
ncbi:MAG: hypothetical protein R3B13_13825 [Polyangiaceae bacterium]